MTEEKRSRVLGMILASVSRGVFPQRGPIVYPTDCLTFTSAEPFSVAVNNATKSWDGTLYYSTDTTTWNEWDGTTAIASATHGSEQRIYMRGSGNSKITGHSDARLVLTGDEISCNGNIENLLDFEVVARGEQPTMVPFCYSSMFSGCTSLKQAPVLPATTLANHCYRSMFSGCTSLKQAPVLPATALADYCYYYMFSGCTGIKLSETQTDEYLAEYRIPSVCDGTIANHSLGYMFSDTGGTFTGTPEINTTYYLHKDNAVVSCSDL